MCRHQSDPHPILPVVGVVDLRAGRDQDDGGSVDLVSGLKSMKIQVDLDGDLWGRFRDKVQGEGKTLREVVPTLFEPALRAYLDPPQEPLPSDEAIDKAVPPQSRDYQPPPMPTVKRCELCDMPVDRLFHSEGRRVCYSCWKGELTKDREVSNTSPSSEPSPSSVSSPS